MFSSAEGKSDPYWSPPDSESDRIGRMTAVVRNVDTAKRDKLLFLIAKSSNDNCVAYEYGETSSGFNLRPYWILCNAGKLENFSQLNMAESLLYGVAVSVKPTGECIVNFNAEQIRGRSVELIMDSEGHPALLGYVDSKMCRLQYAYVQMRKGLIPDVEYLHLYGKGVADGVWHKERIVNTATSNAWV
jgi:hypothetical protein